MTKDEALDLALEALEICEQDGYIPVRLTRDSITAIKQARALDKKAENARELGLDYGPAPVQEPFCFYYVENGEEYFAPKGAYVPDNAQPLYTTPPASLVRDEHQAFIDSLPKDGEDKMFMQIDHWARESYKRHQSSVRGHMITAADSYESHIIWATLRWAKENTSPNVATPLAAPVQEVSWGVDWGKAGDKSCAMIIKRLPDGKIEVVAVEYEP